jgi:hypothetical protein
MSLDAEHLWPRHKGIAVQESLEYTCGIPRPAGSAGLGAHAWRKVAKPGKQTTRELNSRQLVRLWVRAREFVLKYS